MNKEMPATSRTFLRSRSITCLTGGRCSRGFNWTNIRPEFCAPVPPLKDPTVATAGSARRMAAAWLWSRTISGNEVSSAASVVTVICPMSSSGKKPFGIAMKSQTVTPRVVNARSNISFRNRSAESSERLYAASNASNARSKIRITTECRVPGASVVKKRLANIGTIVSEAKADTMIERPTITANSWNRRPITPGMKKIGMKTAIRDEEIERMVNPTSREPLRAA